MSDARALVFPGQCRVDYASNSADQSRLILPFVPQMGPVISAPGSSDEAAAEVLTGWLDSPSGEYFWVSLDGAKTGAETYVNRYKAAVKYFEEQSVELAQQFRSRPKLDAEDLKLLLDRRATFEARLKEMFVPMRKFSVIRETELAEYAKRIGVSESITDIKALKNFTRNTARGIASPANTLKDAAIVADFSKAEKIAKAGRWLIVLELLPIAAKFLKVRSLQDLNTTARETAPELAGTLAGYGASELAALGIVLVAGEFFTVALVPIAVGIVVQVGVKELTKMALH